MNENELKGSRVQSSRIDSKVEKSPLKRLNSSTLEPLKEGWRWVKLGDICELIMGQSPPGNTYTDKPEGQPFFQGKADFGEYFPTVRMWCTQPIKIAEDGDILISVRAPVGPVNISNLKCCIGRGLTAIRCKDNTINWFIFWYLQSIEEKIASLGSGSTFSAISRDDLANLQIPLPPIEEQEGIVSKLQELMQEVERARAACEKQLEGAKALSAAYLREVFGSEEAKKWERRKIGEVCEKPQYGYTAIAESSEVGPKFLRITDIQNGKVNWQSVPFCRCDDVHKYLLESGNILVARTGATTGKSYLIKEIIPKTIFASYLIRIRALHSLVPEFLYLFLQSNIYWQQVEANKRGGAQPNMNATLLANIVLPLPPISGQQRIVADLKGKMAEVENLESTIQNQQSALNALPQAILRQAFNGEL